MNGERFTVLLVILSAFTGTQRAGHNGAQRPFLPRQASGRFYWPSNNVGDIWELGV